MNETGISWTNLTWNVWSGCKKVSPGCKHCYAETLSENKRGSKAFPNGFDLTFRWHKLDEPLKLKQPSMIFVNSMSDLYLEQVQVPDILRVFQVMNKCPQHTFQILTKRSARIREIASCFEWTPNIWQGVSIENDKYKGRIDDLREVPAHVRFLSIEPLIGPLGILDLSGIHWVIVGGESGPGHRSMDQGWAREVKDQCVEQGVAFFYKQDAGWRSGLRPFLVEPNGKAYEWHQFPGQLTKPRRVQIPT